MPPFAVRVTTTIPQLMLQLEIEFLSGVCYATSERGSADPEWPPQPGRLFSALVAAWGARGNRDDERAALEWLERQSVPLIDASESLHRLPATVFVPTNDAKSARDGNIKVLPDRRGRQPRQFPATRPIDPTVRFTWPAEPTNHDLNLLAAIARDVVYLGHSSSLVRLRFTLVESGRSTAAGTTVRVPYAGRLAELERAYRAGRRPNPGQPEAIAKPAITTPASTFGEKWIVLRDGGGWKPAAQATAIVTKLLRDTLVAPVGSDGTPVPEWLSGYTPDGSPTQQPHLAIIPLLDVGWEYSIGRLMGLALILPRTADAAMSDTLNRTLERLVGDGTAIRLPLGPHEWLLEPIEDMRASLDPRRWMGLSNGLARHWTTATPIVLDRHPKGPTADARQRQAQTILATACEQAGFPVPLAVRLAKHSSLTGAVSAAPSSGSPSWTAWSLTPPLRGCVLTHATIEFTDPVRGPVLLGAGRFSGLGLCLPLPADDRPT